ncbi:MAG: PAS domain-containing protein [Cyanobacteria bacterium]|nr:PAS domain-containing protein [Cyanobacteriota bacterium]
MNNSARIKLYHILFTTFIVIGLIISLFLKNSFIFINFLCLMLIVALSFFLGIKGSLPALFFSIICVICYNYINNFNLNTPINIIVIVNYSIISISFGIARDIYLKQRNNILKYAANLNNAKESLDSKNELLEKILSNIPAIFYIRDTNLKFTKVNNAFENLVNKKASDIIGKTDFDLYPEVNAKKMAQDDVEVLNSDKPKLNIEENILMPDGRNIWLIANKMPLHDKDGKVIGIMGISHDITELKKMSVQVETILDSFPYKAWLKDKEGHFLAVNELLAKSVFKSKKEMIGKTDFDIYPEEHAKRFREDDLAIMNSREAKSFEEMSYDNNTTKLHETYKAPVINEAGEVIGTTGYARDISEIQKCLFESRELNNFFNSVIDNIPIMLFLKEAKDLRFRMINKATEELLGLSREDLIGKTDYDVFPKYQADFFVKKDREVLNNGTQLLIEEEKITSKNKKMILSTKKIPILDENGKPAYLLGISEDITNKKQMEKMIKKLAYYDFVTNLPNRNLFKDRFKIAVEQAKRNNKKIMITMIDFDKFKEINDKYGHNIGDKLLKSFANRIKRIVRKTDTFARFGGDEFAMILSDFYNIEDMEKFAKKIIDSFKEPFKISELKLNIKGSMGISIYPDDGLKQSDLVKFADIAMYDSKNNGGNKYQFYFRLKENKKNVNSVQLN